MSAHFTIYKRKNLAYTSVSPTANFVTDASEIAWKSRISFQEKTKCLTRSGARHAKCLKDRKPQ